MARKWTPKDTSILKDAEKTFRVMTVALRRLDGWLSDLNRHVPFDSIPQPRAERVAGMMWKTEMVRRILENEHPAAAFTDLLKYVQHISGGSVMFQEVGSKEEFERLTGQTVDEPDKRGGYL